MVTAAKGASTWVQHSTHTVEQWVNGQFAEDIIFKPAPGLFILNALCRVEKPLGKYHPIRILDSRGATAIPFGGYDTLTPSPHVGAHAGQATVANYAIPIMFSWEDEMEYAVNPTADRMEEGVEQAKLTLRETLGQDLYKGNSVDSKRILGLEQWNFAQNHDTSNTTFARVSAEWQVKQPANSIAGLQRVAWTATVEGTGWENVSIRHGNIANSVMGYSSGAPNAALLALIQAYGFSTIGGEEPNAIFASRKRWEDFFLMAVEKTQLRRDEFAAVNTRGQSVNLGHPNIKFNNCAVIQDPFALTQNASTFSSADLGGENLHILNTSSWRFLVDSRAPGKLMKPKAAQHQLAATRWLVIRLQNLCINPRLNARVYESAD